MCKFCTIEPGDTEVIQEQVIELVRDGKVCGKEVLCLGYYVSDADAQEHYLYSYYSVDGQAHDRANFEIPIQYCPFCGRKLPTQKNTDN